MRLKIERVIQDAVIAWVKMQHPELMVTGTDNENNYKNVASIGSLGIPDLIIFHKSGKVFFLELKTMKRKNEKNGGLGDNQIKWNEDFDLNWSCDNFQRNVAYGLADARDAVTAWVNSFH